VPDDNFEQALINLGHDDVLDDYITTSNVSGVTSLEIGNKNIRDLTGIEAFVKITDLRCAGNFIENLDLFANTQLEYLGLYKNELTSINISTCTELEYLELSYNNLTNIDISACTKLECLCISYNYLTNLDLSTNTKLVSISCTDNKLTNLDISPCIQLNTLDCAYNNLTNIDGSACEYLRNLYCYRNNLININLSNCVQLNTLFCSYNKLINLDLNTNSYLKKLRCNNNLLSSLNVKNGANSLISTFVATGNPSLQCIQVDNETDASSGVTPYDTWQKDAAAIYSEDCSSLGVDDEELAQDLKMYPNPVTESLSFESKIPIEKVEIYSILGLKVKEIDSDFNSISTSYLSRGIYLVRIYSEKGSTVRKLIKQ